MAFLLFFGSAFFVATDAEAEGCPCHEVVALESPEESPCEDGCRVECENCHCCGAQVGFALSRMQPTSSVFVGSSQDRISRPYRAPPEGVLDRIFVPPRGTLT